MKCSGKYIEPSLESKVLWACGAQDVITACRTQRAKTTKQRVRVAKLSFIATGGDYSEYRCILLCS